MKFTLLTLTLFWASISFAQEDLYHLSTFSRSYEPLTDATVIFEDPSSWVYGDTQLPLGFDFTIQDKTMSTAFIQDLTFLATNQTINLQTAGVIFGVLYVSPRLTADNTLASTISYKTEGNVGSRIFKLEFKNVTFDDQLTTPYDDQSYFNYQLWLYEEDNSAEIIFGESNLNMTIQEATNFVGPFFSIVNAYDEIHAEYEHSWYAYGNLSNPMITYNPVVDEVNTTLEHLCLADLPQANQVYRFALSSTVSTENTIKTPLALYPTIAQDMIYIKGLDNYYQYQITDISGRIISNNILSSNTIDVSTYEKGMYFISLFDNGQITKVGRFIKQ